MVGALGRRRTGRIGAVPGQVIPPRRLLSRIELADGAVRQLSDNTIPGITFSGLEVAPDGSLLYVRQESNRDIWTIQFPK